jgi:hypothetical protein
MMWPGTYIMTSPVTIPSFVGVQGINKGLVQLVNATTDMFHVSDDTWFHDFLVEGQNAPSTTIFVGNNNSRVHVRNVDLLFNAGNNKQSFIFNTGATWQTWIVEHCILDSWKTSGYLISLINSGAAARFVDVIINDIASDLFQLTDFGGTAYLQGVQDVRFERSTLRGTDAGSPNKFHTGIYLAKGGVTGTPQFEVFACKMCGAQSGSGGVACFGEAGTDYVIDNSLARGATTAGTSTVRNSTVTA